MDFGTKNYVLAPCIHSPVLALLVLLRLALRGCSAHAPEVSGV